MKKRTQRRVRVYVRVRNINVGDFKTSSVGPAYFGPRAGDPVRAPVGLGGIARWFLTRFGEDDVGRDGRRAQGLVHVHHQRGIDLLFAHDLPGLDSQAAARRTRAPVSDRPPEEQFDRKYRVPFVLQQ